MIAVVSYGAGNTGSVLKAAKRVGLDAHCVETPDELVGAEKIILPGQGHFGAMMQSLASRNLIEPLRAAIEAGTPLLGICLGLQVLYSGSDEAPGIDGLGILAGRVRKLEGVFKIPHVGWSRLHIRRETKILSGVAEGSYVYYCHSYYGSLTPETGATTRYGVEFPAVVEIRNICAVQFHPEKSSRIGLRILENFARVALKGRPIPAQGDGARALT
jgi:imidazole glycerol-phosphate synthase subunit HisH